MGRLGSCCCARAVNGAACGHGPHGHADCRPPPQSLIELCLTIGHSNDRELNNTKEPKTMNTNYQICRQHLSRLNFDELLVFDAYGRQHRDPDDIAAAMGLSPREVIAQLENLAA